MSAWDERFVASEPSAAKIFAVAWVKNIENSLKARGMGKVDSSLLRETYHATIKESSSLPVGDEECLEVTLLCAVNLLTFYHPFGFGFSNVLGYGPGWSQRTYETYFTLLREHGLKPSLSH